MMRLKKFLRTHKTFVLSIGFLALFSFAVSQAAPMYSPGQTLDPQCVPGSTDCTVAVVPPSPVVANGNDAYFTGGNFGIGTTTPSAPLDVNGEAKLGSLTVTGIGPTFSIAAPTNLQATIVQTPDNNYFNDGDNHNYRVYAYRDIGGGQRVYSAGYTTLSSDLVDDNQQSYKYNVELTWNAVPGADGYRVIVEGDDDEYWSEGYTDGYDVTTTSLVDDSGRTVYFDPANGSVLPNFVGNFSNTNTLNGNTNMLGNFILTGASSSLSDPLFNVVNASDSGNPYNALTVFNNGYVGINAGTTPRAALTIGGDGAIVASGTLGSGVAVPDMGAGTRMVWIPSTGAFRAGTIDDTQWDSANVGQNSVAFGDNNIASGTASAAFGKGNTSSGNRSFSAGSSSTASGYAAIALGQSTASGSNSVALGTNSTASGFSAIALGGGNASADNSIAIGSNSTTTNGNAFAVSGGNAEGDTSVAIGHNSHTEAFYSLAMAGGHVTSFASNGIAIGEGATTSGNYGVSIGRGSIASNNDTVALGEGIASGNQSVAIGLGTASGSGAFVLGSSFSTQASGLNALAFGNGTTASGDAASVFGTYNTASGNTSLAFGNGNTASGAYSTVFGEFNTAQAEGSFVIGQNNVGGGDSANWVETDPLFEVGNGTDPGSGIVQSDAFIVLKNGKTGIALNPAVNGGQPQYTLQVGSTAIGTGNVVARFQNGSGTCDINPTSSSLTCSSDMRLKKNVTNIADSSAWSFNTNIAAANQSVLSHVLALTPVSYNWNTETDTAAKHPGFIAQEVQEVFPDLVATDPSTGLLSLNYTGLIPYTVQAIKEMDLNVTSIDDLTKTNTWRDSLLAWFGDAGNGITSFFSKKITTDELCVGTTCVTQQQFLQMVQNSNNGGTVTVIGGGSAAPAQNDAGTQTPEVQEEQPATPAEDQSSDTGDSAPGSGQGADTATESQQ